MRSEVLNEVRNAVVGFGENGNYSIWKDKIIVENNLSYGGGVPIEFIYLSTAIVLFLAFIFSFSYSFTNFIG